VFDDADLEAAAETIAAVGYVNAGQDCTAATRVLRTPGGLVIDTDLPAGPSASPLTRGFAACLASVTEVAVTELPLPAGDLPQALGAWRTWLAERGSGLAPTRSQVSEPPAPYRSYRGR
jgi:Aldehyde dehydrogenase family